MATPNSLGDLADLYFTRIVFRNCDTITSQFNRLSSLAFSSNAIASCINNLISLAYYMALVNEPS